MHATMTEVEKTNSVETVDSKTAITEEKKTESVVRCLSVAIVKPTNCTWEQAGSALRVVSKACGAAANLCQTKILQEDMPAYEKVGWGEKGLTFEKIGNKLDIPKLDKIDAKIYAFASSKFPFVSSRAINFVSRDVKSRYMKSRLKIMTGQVAAPSYKNFPITTDQYSINFDEVTNDYTITVSILSTNAAEMDCPKRISFILNTGKLRGEYLQVLKDISKGDRKASTIKMIFLQNKKKWVVNIPYEINIDDKKQHVYSDRVMTVSAAKGIFLRCSYKHNAGKNGTWHDDIEYESMKHTRIAYEKRNRAMSNKYRQDSESGSVGHGLKRAIKNKTKWQEKYKRACKTFNQQRAAYIIKLALRWKCGNINYICPDDIPIDGYKLFDSWPWYQLEQCVKNKAEEFGIKFTKIDQKEKVLEIVNAVDNAWQTE